MKTTYNESLNPYVVWKKNSIYSKNESLYALLISIMLAQYTRIYEGEIERKTNNK